MKSGPPGYSRVPQARSGSEGGASVCPSYRGRGIEEGRILEWPMCIGTLSHQSEEAGNREPGSGRSGQDEERGSFF